MQEELSQTAPVFSSGFANPFGLSIEPIEPYRKSRIMSSEHSNKLPTAPLLPENVRAVFFDIDDTFYSHKLDRIPAGYLEMIDALRSQGIYCALCTARAKTLIENLFGDLFGKWDGIVAGNGAFVYDENLQPLFEKPIPEDTVRQICALAEQYQAGVFVSGSDAFTFDALPTTQKKLDSVHISGLAVRPLAKDDRISVMSICHETPHILKEPLEAIGGLFIHETAASIDLSRDDLSKFEGIRILMDHWHLGAHDYAAFGDSLNDLEMLENAACGYAVAESEPVITARFETMPPVEEGGIAAWMKENGWIA